ncbi:hypothetical protein LptCag_0184 [Leptospirillum ferriphilum]|uniref:Uncharacterized protein n=1 Tax=Leptospirillum ferriphilum TaxID=178606 RepID=A0A094YK66_9BACT|nr:hypothetical protein LptCag_0184 [Leptospirillum ferriphilum]
MIMMVFFQEEGKTFLFWREYAGKESSRRKLFRFGIREVS